MHRYLPLRHTPQERRYWCGPAAVHMALATRLDGGAPSQWDLAQDHHLRTETHHETPNRFVMRDTLNALLGTSRYEVRDIVGEHFEVERDRFRTELVAAIDGGWPVVATLWLRPGQSRPAGYPDPTGEGIKHIVAIYAYEDLGDMVLVADPASGGQDVSWADLIPPTYPLTVDSLVTQMRGKGYVA